MEAAQLWERERRRQNVIDQQGVIVHRDDVKEGLQEFRQCLAEPVGIHLRECCSPAMAFAIALDYLMLVITWTAPKHRSQGSIWKVMHQARRLFVEVFRDRILHSPCTEIKVAPGHGLFIEKMPKTS